MGDTKGSMEKNVDAIRKTLAFLKRYYPGIDFKVNMIEKEGGPFFQIKMEDGMDPYRDITHSSGGIYALLKYAGIPLGSTIRLQDGTATLKDLKFFITKEAEFESEDPLVRQKEEMHSNYFDFNIRRRSRILDLIKKEVGKKVTTPDETVQCYFKVSKIFEATESPFIEDLDKISVIIRFAFKNEQDSKELQSKITQMLIQNGWVNENNVNADQNIITLEVDENKEPWEPYQYTVSIPMTEIQIGPALTEEQEAPKIGSVPSKADKADTKAEADSSIKPDSKTNSKHSMAGFSPQFDQEKQKAVTSRQNAAKDDYSRPKTPPL